MAKFHRFEEAPSKGPHRDYELNLKIARAFCEKVGPNLPHGMQTYVTGSHNLKDNILMISWMPGRYEPMGNYANPINLHQPRSDAAYETKATYEFFIRKIGDFRERFPVRDEDLFQV